MLHYIVAMLQYLYSDVALHSSHIFAMLHFESVSRSWDMGAVGNGVRWGMGYGGEQDRGSVEKRGTVGGQGGRRGWRCVRGRAARVAWFDRIRIGWDRMFSVTIIERPKVQTLAHAER